ncbi:hypothetical protein E3P99_00273 [Wallemia hederae]|uniref:BZIP domain-containing protein n=1 Tax=Wallemia hederae TaxID=1540922 RepID=A0A4T0FXF2_9BASI|nr:hypothetical protein E3P99_00273 [Wallemia hederae]
MATIKAAPSRELSGKIYVQPTKNWEIPARPKPGRKPIDADPPNRKSQNRVAQRAFRERKQEYVQELEQRLQAYEANSIERNVALQQVSQKLKQENDALKDENTELRVRLARYERQDVASMSSAPSSSGGSSRNLSTNSQNTATHRAIKRKFKDTYNSSYSNGESYVEYRDVHQPVLSQSIPSSLPPTPQTHTQISPQKPPAIQQHSPVKLQVDDELDRFFSCGFCSEETPCVCRQVSAQDEAQLVAPMIATAPAPAPTSTTSLLDNPPSFAPAQPLRKKRTTSKKLFAVQTECSGDPDNCMACQVDDSLACRDDKPGRAFFEALQGSVCQDGEGKQKCDGCPTHQRGQHDAEHRDRDTPTERGQEDTLVDANGQSIPASDAWRRLKSHPNIGLADLALLADLVGSRTRCTGAELHQQVEKVLENVPSQAEVTVDVDRLNSSSSSAQARTPTARRNSTSLQLPQLVPQDQLVSSSKRRKLLVEMGAVRDALDVLDRFSAPPI